MHPPASLQVKEVRAAALALKLKLEEIEAQSDPKGLESAFQTAKQKQVGAIMTTTATGYFAERKHIVGLAGKYRLPAIYFQKEFVDEGGLMSYGADYDDLFRRAAVYVDKILKGAKPADLPVQQATKFEFVINLKAAKQRSDNSRPCAGAGESGHQMNIGIRQKTLGNKTGKGMNREIFVCLLTGCLMCIALFAQAQQPKIMPRIGWVSGSGTPNAPGPQVEAFRQGLARARLCRGEKHRG